MEIIDEKTFDNAKDLPKVIKPTRDGTMEELSDDEFNFLLESMNNPANAQKQVAVQIKCFLDHRIKQEMKDKGVLSDHTRRWVESYNTILTSLHKELYGEKSVNLHLHKVSHSHIMSKIRKVNANDNSSRRRNRTDENKDRK